MRARVDFSRYPGGAETLKNLLVDERGGIYRRAGSYFTVEVKNSANQTRLIDIVPNDDEAYAVEFGAAYFRFIKNQGQIAAPTVSSAISNGTFATDLTDWTDADTGTGASAFSSSHGGSMSLNGGGTGNSDIAAREQSVAIPPADQAKVHVLKFRVVGDYGPISDAAAGGLAPGRGGEWATLRIGTSSNGEQLLADTNFGNGHHTVSFTPNASLIYVRFQHRWRAKAIYVKDVSFHTGALELTHPYTQSQIASVHWAGTGDFTYFVHADVHPYKLIRRGDYAWSMEQVGFIDGPYGDENNDANLTVTPGAATGFGVTFTASRALFEATDVGRLIRDRESASMSWGVIVSRSSTTVVTVDIVVAFVVAAQVQFALGAWSGTTGFPQQVELFKQRAVYGCTETQPNTVWLSQAADIENMSPDTDAGSVIQTEDDDAITYTLVEKRANRIVGFSAGRDLLALTAGSEIPMSSDGPSITPTDVQASPQTTYGSNGVDPIAINSVTVFVQKGGRRILRLGFDIRIEGYAAEDLTILSEHITRSGVSKIAHAQEPNSIIWCVLSNGTLAALTFHPEQQVAGWSRHVLGGKFQGRNAVVEDLITIPGNTSMGSNERDEVWVIAKRTIGGSTKRYIEFLERDFDQEDNLEDAVYCDSALSVNAWNTDTAKTLILGSLLDPDDDDLWDEDDTLTMTATGHTPFTSGDVGDSWQLRYKGEVFLVEITAFSSSSSVTVRLTRDCPSNFRAASVHEWLDPDSKFSSVSGAGHLEGETVVVLGDGGVQGEKTVSGGAITLDASAGAVTIGLKYDHRYKSLKFESGAILGSAMGKPKKIHDLTLELFAATAFYIGPRFDDDPDNEGNISMTLVPTREGIDPVGVRAKLWTREYPLRDFPGRWERDARICIRGDDPRPFFMLAIAPEMLVQETI